MPGAVRVDPKGTPHWGPRLVGRLSGGCGLGIRLVLPVVICLSQRLSHARVSTGLHRVKLGMAH